MKYNRSIKPSTKLTIVCLTNLGVGMLFIVLFNYFVWGVAYDVIGSAIGLIAIGAGIATAIGFDVYYMWYWQPGIEKHMPTLTRYEKMCDRGNFAEKVGEHSQRPN